MTEKYIILSGSLAIGFESTGPFDSETEAELYGEKWFDDREFWVFELNEVRKGPIYEIPEDSCSEQTSL